MVEGQRARFQGIAVSGKIPYNSKYDPRDSGVRMALAKSDSVNRKMERVEARLPADIKAIIQHAADLTGRSLSDFIVNSAREAAEETIREHEVIMLSARDGRIFFQAVLEPAEPNDTLVEAFRRRRELFGE